MLRYIHRKAEGVTCSSVKIHLHYFVLCFHSAKKSNNNKVIYKFIMQLLWGWRWASAFLSGLFECSAFISGFPDGDTFIMFKNLIGKNVLPVTTG